MALDEANHRLFVATRTPPPLGVFDTSSGRLIAALPVVQDADDLYYDSGRKRIYVPGGEGFVSVFQQDDRGPLPSRGESSYFRWRSYGRLLQKG